MYCSVQEVGFNPLSSRKGKPYGITREGHILTKRKKKEKKKGITMVVGMKFFQVCSWYSDFQSPSFKNYMTGRPRWYSFGVMNIQFKPST